VTQTLGIGAVFSASHRATPDGPLHGHSYEVIVWFKAPVDGDRARREVEEVVSKLDHTDITGHGVAEDLAEWLGGMILWFTPQFDGIQPFRVDVNRPLERVYATWTRDPA